MPGLDSRPSDDRWLWLGFGVFFVVAAKGIAAVLKHIAELNTRRPFIAGLKSGRLVPPRPEDSISNETLGTLTQSPNLELQKSAVGLLLTRLHNSPTDRQSFIDDLFHEDDDIRLRAESLLRLFNNTETFTSSSPLEPLTNFYNCWRYDRVGHLPDLMPTAFYHARALQIAGDNRAFDELVRLCREYTGAPFNFENLPSLGEWQTRAWFRYARLRSRPGIWVDEERMRRQAMAALFDRDIILDADLTRAPLLPLESSIPGVEDYMPRRNAFGSQDVEDEGDNAARPRSRRPRPLSAEESFEEAEMRRRRREAMILHEGEGDIERDDIIQRTSED